MQASGGWRRRLAGLVWLGIWMVVLYGVAAPWRELGGIVDEQLRWFEWFVLLSGLTTGLTVGRLGRIVAVESGRLTHHRFLRCLLYPPAAVATAALIVLAVLGREAAIGIVVTALLSYWAGLDLGFAVVPLLDGEPYAFGRPASLEGSRQGREIEPRWVPPWERY